jgi:AcrR family transcriptional regulator
MGRPREHDEGTRTALLVAAEGLVHEHGPAAVSIRTVAEAAGTSTRAVYSLFGSKAGLLEALATQLFRMLTAAIEAAPRTDDPVADVVTASTEGFRRIALEHPSLYSLVFLRVVPDLELGPEHTTVAMTTFAQLVALLERVKATRGLGERSAEDAAQAVHALTEGLATVELRGELGDPARARMLWEQSITALVSGFATDAGPRARRDGTTSPDDAPGRCPTLSVGGPS